MTRPAGRITGGFSFFKFYTKENTGRVGSGQELFEISRVELGRVGSGFQ